MLAYSKRKGIIVSIIIALIIWLSLNFILIRSQEALKKDSNFNSILTTTPIAEYEEIYNINKIENDVDITKELVLNADKPDDWNIYIQSVNLKINLVEGTAGNIMNGGLYHWDKSGRWNGNVIIMNFDGFTDEHDLYDRLDKVEEGDIIEYQYKGQKRTYKVTDKIYGGNEDRSYYEDTEDDRLTISTYSEKWLECTLCIQAKPEA